MFTTARTWIVVSAAFTTLAGALPAGAQKPETAAPPRPGSSAGAPASGEDRAALDRHRAAAASDPRAGWMAGMLILRGVDPNAGPADAYRLVRAAAEAGDVNAQVSTGVMLATGQGVRENDAEARTWYARAAQQGSAHALRAVAGMMLIGEGGPTDTVRGVGLMRVAAAAGDRPAQQILSAVPPLSPEQSAAADEVARAWVREHPNMRAD